jgi:transcriptional regulator with XRE-family HTH domain
MNIIGSCIANRRIDLGLSQQEVARKIGKTQAAISNIEAGKRTPSIGMLHLIAQALQVQMSQILEGL